MRMIVIDAYFGWALVKVCCFLGILWISMWVLYLLMTRDCVRTLLVLGGIMAVGTLIATANLVAKVDRQVALEAAHD